MKKNAIWKKAACAMALCCCSLWLAGEEEAPKKPPRDHYQDWQWQPVVIQDENASFPMVIFYYFSCP